MRDLYARFVLWLIRPALEANRPSMDAMRDVVIDTIINDARKNGPASRAMKGGL